MRFNFKKTQILILLLVMVVYMTACSKGEKEDKTKGTDLEIPSVTSAVDQSDDKGMGTIDSSGLDDLSDNEYILNVSTDKKGVDIDDLMYGLFFEDINNAADGGIYAEMVINRSFEFDSIEAISNGAAVHGYKSFNDAELEIHNETPLNEKNQQYAKIINHGSDEPAGIYNTGFLDGMCIEEGKDYRFTVYLKSDDYKGSVGVYLQNKDGNMIAEAMVDSVTNEWVKYELKLTASESANPARLLVTVNESGSVEADMISLFPYDTYKNRENGLRTDLVELLEELNPRFIRFPGGCLVEGDTLENAYNWKDTVGDVAERKVNYNLWRGNGAYPYHQSYGLGFYEYFLLCEDLGAEPIPILNCGMGCQVRGGDLASMEELDAYIQDALDLVEFANGDTDTVWGALRAKMGHPEPFNLAYIGIGNEQYGAAYFERYEKFAEVLRREHPEIQLITSAGAWSDGDMYHYAWNRIQSHNYDEVPYADLVDEHYYNDPEWFLKNVYRYDEYSRDGAGVFLGEYAAKSNTLYAAVAEAAYMTALERNADVVRMASYAPLFGSTVHSHWSPDLVWFKNNEVYGSVNYYVQKMYANHVGDYTLESELKGDLSASSIKGRFGIGTWLTSASFDDIKVVDNQTGEILYENDFEERGSDWLMASKGDWALTDDNGNQVFTQSNKTFPTDNEIMGSTIYNGDVNWSDYTLTLRAKKNTGNEGFLISFGVQDTNNFYFWNIGGWNNTLSVVEEAQGGTKVNACESVPMSVQAARWYEIKVVVMPEQIECYIDDNLIHAIEVNGVLPVYETVSKDEATGDIILKLVNAGDTEAVVHINLDDTITKGEAYTEVLSGENKNAQNTLSNKENIVPIEGKIDVDASFDYYAPPYSVNIIRIPT